MNRLLKFCKKGNLKKVKQILYNNIYIDLTAHDDCSIIRTCESGNLKLVQFLLNLSIHTTFGCETGGFNYRFNYSK